MALPALQCRVCLAVCDDAAQRAYADAWRPHTALLDIELTYCPTCQEKAKDEQMMNGGGAGTEKP